MESQKPLFIGGDMDAVKLLGITLRGEDGSLGCHNLDGAQIKIMENHLIKTFGVDGIFYSEPFIILSYDPKIAGPGELPLSVGGLIPIWRPDVYGNADFWPWLGCFGQGEGVTLEGDRWHSIDIMQGPTFEQLRELADELFTECEALTFHTKTLVVELPRMSEDDFIKRLQTLPEYIRGLPFVTQYHNGPVVGRETRLHYM
ncbi:hypothetical protein QBC43DRAFT_287823 [Cladorrhinum sp. PSN259]|nr:hypothetical protein QBC43DRAFT_287823 [Cladorrhinum sp. PSN259]